MLACLLSAIKRPGLLTTIFHKLWTPTVCTKLNIFQHNKSFPHFDTSGANWTSSSNLHPPRHLKRFKRACTSNLKVGWSLVEIRKRSAGVNVDRILTILLTMCRSKKTSSRIRVLFNCEEANSWQVGRFTFMSHTQTILETPAAIRSHQTSSVSDNICFKNSIFGRIVQTGPYRS